MSFSDTLFVAIFNAIYFDNNMPKPHRRRMAHFYLQDKSGKFCLTFNAKKEPFRSWQCVKTDFTKTQVCHV